MSTTTLSSFFVLQNNKKPVTLAGRTGWAGGRAGASQDENRANMWRPVLAKNVNLRDRGIIAYNGATNQIVVCLSFCERAHGVKRVRQGVTFYDDEAIHRYRKLRLFFCYVFCRF